MPNNILACVAAICLTLQPAPTHEARVYAQFGEALSPDATLKAKFTALNSWDGEQSEVDAKTVNTFINSFEYQDYEHGFADYWKDPGEFYTEGGGDCEDYAIAKYYALKKHHDVWVVVAISRTEPDVVHAVLLMDKEFILDNQTNKIYRWKDFIKKWEPQYAVDEYELRRVQ